MTIRAPIISRVIREKRLTETQVSVNLLLTVLAVAAVSAPFKQSNWLNPRPIARQAPQSVWPNLLVTTLSPAVVASPFSQNDWRNQTVRVFYQDYSWIQNLQQTTLVGGAPVLAKHRGFLINVSRLLSG